jgi:hypothetical protein
MQMFYGIEALKSNLNRNFSEMCRQLCSKPKLFLVPGRVDCLFLTDFLQSDLVLYLDSSGGTAEACSAPLNRALL